jgi:hypothetical protein
MPQKVYHTGRFFSVFIMWFLSFVVHASVRQWRRAFVYSCFSSHASIRRAKMGLLCKSSILKGLRVRPIFRDD